VWGLIKKLGDKDVRSITTRDYKDYMDFLDQKNPTWASATKNTIMATIRNALKVARDERVIDSVPETPRSKQKDNPRPFFRFHPLVSEDQDAVEKLLLTATDMALDGVVVRGIPVTSELYSLCLFLLYSFVRPITSELYALRF
jgi:hypothetical protein